MRILMMKEWCHPIQLCISDLVIFFFFNELTIWKVNAFLKKTTGNEMTSSTHDLDEFKKVKTQSKLFPLLL